MSTTVSDSVKKQIGFCTALSLVMGIVIGGGILVLPSALAKYGSWGFWAWPIASIAVLNLAFMFGFLSKKHPQASGPSSFVQKYFGESFGFQMAWAHGIGLSLGTAVVAISFASYLVSVFGLTPSYNMYISLFALWSIFSLKALYTLLSLKALVVITFMKIFALSLVIINGIGSTSMELFTAPAHDVLFDGFNGLFGALALVLFAFIGIEGATLPGEHVKNASKTIPRATIIGTLLSALLFTGTYAVVWSVVPNGTLVTTNSPVADAASIVMGVFGFKLISILAVIGCVGSINGCLYAASHIFRSSAEAGWLPKVFGKMTAASFPIWSGLLSAALSSVVLCAYYLVDSSASVIVRNNAAQLEVFLVSIVYLMSCMCYKLAGGNKYLWILGVLSCIGFLFGSMDDYLSACLGVMVFFSGIIVYTAFAHKMTSHKTVK